MYPQFEMAIFFLRLAGIYVVFAFAIFFMFTALTEHSKGAARKGLAIFALGLLLLSGNGYAYGALIIILTSILLIYLIRVIKIAIGQ